MSEKKSYNVTPDIDDMEYVDMMGLDPELAYTPEINDAILQHIYSENIKHYLDRGDELDLATQKAQVHLNQGKATVKHAIEKRGY